MNATDDREYINYPMKRQVRWRHRSVWLRPWWTMRRKIEKGG